MNIRRQEYPAPTTPITKPLVKNLDFLVSSKAAKMAIGRDLSELNTPTDVHIIIDSTVRPDKSDIIGVELLTRYIDGKSKSSRVLRSADIYDRAHGVQIEIPLVGQTRMVDASRVAGWNPWTQQRVYDITDSLVRSVFEVRDIEVG